MEEDFLKNPPNPFLYVVSFSMVCMGFFLISMLFFSCSPQILVKPLKPKEKAIYAGLGGPLIQFSGLVIPVPISQIGMGYGINEKLTGQLGLGTTSAAFGVAHLQAGILYGLKAVGGSSPGVSLQTQQHFFMDKWKGHFRWYPEMGFSGFHEWGAKKNLIFLNATSFVEMEKLSANIKNQSFLIPWVGLGYQRHLPHWTWHLEARWLAPFEDNRNLVVEYVTPGTKGGIGIYIGLVRKW